MVRLIVIELATASPYERPQRHPLDANQRKVDNERSGDNSPRKNRDDDLIRRCSEFLHAWPREHVGAAVMVVGSVIRASTRPFCTVRSPDGGRADA